MNKRYAPRMLDILYSKFWAATSGLRSFLPPLIMAWISPNIDVSRTEGRQKHKLTHHNTLQDLDHYGKPPKGSILTFFQV